jgi:NADP-dependent 3-hydroxy acid dehydrogenase YdfG
VNRGPKVVVITGASAGVGRAAARKFARHGARIGLLARGNDGLRNLITHSRLIRTNSSLSPVLASTVRIFPTPGA